MTCKHAWSKKWNINWEYVYYYYLYDNDEYMWECMNSDKCCIASRRQVVSCHDHHTLILVVHDDDKDDVKQNAILYQENCYISKTMLHGPTNILYKFLY